MLMAFLLLHELGHRLKQALADKTLELDFFKGALQKVEVRRQPQDVTGAQTSNPGSDVFARQLEY